MNDPANFTTFGQQKTRNVAPIQSNPSPSNGATGQDFNPTTLSIIVGDANLDKMNVTFRTNASGSWATIGTNSSVYNGTYSQVPSNMNSPETTYWWSVNVTDGVLWSNQTYSFTTASVIILRPNAAGRSTQLSGQSGGGEGDNYGYVDDDPWDGADYVYTTNQGTWINDSYNISNSLFWSEDVIKVRIYLSGEYAGSSTIGAENQIKPVIYDNLSKKWYDSDAAQELTNTYVNYSWTHTTNPATSNVWEWAEIDDLEVGVALIGEVFEYSRCAQVYIEVYYK